MCAHTYKLHRGKGRGSGSTAPQEHLETSRGSLAEELAMAWLLSPRNQENRVSPSLPKLRGSGVGAGEIGEALLQGMRTQGPLPRL